MTSRARTVLAALALVAAVGLDAGAQSSGFGISGGIALPTADLDDGITKLGFTGGVMYTRTIKDVWGLRFDAAYSSHGLDGLDGSWGLTSGTVSARWAPHTKTDLKPYFFVGAGFGSVSLEITDPLFGGTTSESGPALTYGVGYNFGSRFFTEVRAVSISTDGFTAAYVPIALGFRF